MYHCHSLLVMAQGPLKILNWLSKCQKWRRRVISQRPWVWKTCRQLITHVLWPRVAHGVGHAGWFWERRSPPCLQIDLVLLCVLTGDQSALPGSCYTRPWISLWKILHLSSSWHWLLHAISLRETLFFTVFPISASGWQLPCSAANSLSNMQVLAHPSWVFLLKKHLALKLCSACSSSPFICLACCLYLCISSAAKFSCSYAADSWFSFSNCSHCFIYRFCSAAIFLGL